MMLAPLMASPYAVRFVPGAEVRSSAGNDTRQFNVVMPKCFVFFVTLYFLAAAALHGFYFWLIFSVPTTAAGQSDFFTQNSWCIVEPLTAGDDADEYNPCIDTYRWWESRNSTGYDRWYGDWCDYDSDVGYAFCNWGPNVTSSWCQEIFDTVVVDVDDYPPGQCGDLSYTFLTPENYTTDGYRFVHEDPPLSPWMWVYPAIMDFWFLWLLWSLCKFPRSIRRDGDAFKVRHCCGSSTVLLDNLQQMAVFNRFNFCAHAYVLRSLRYLSCSLWLGLQANGKGTVALVQHGGAGYNYKLSFTDEEFEAFVADNTGGGGGGGGGSHGGYAGTVAVGPVPVAIRATAVGGDEPVKV